MVYHILSLTDFVIMFCWYNLNTYFKAVHFLNHGSRELWEESWERNKRLSFLAKDKKICIGCGKVNNTNKEMNLFQQRTANKMAECLGMKSDSEIVRL